MPEGATRTPTLTKLLAAVACGVATAMLSACATDDAAKADAAAASEPPPTTTPDRADGLEGLVTDVGGLRVVHEDWRSLGYRWSWSAEADVSRRARVSLVEPIGDGVAVIDSAARLSVLDADSGRVRWATGVASELTAFVDLRRLGRNLLAFGRPELFIFDASSGDVLQRHAMEKSVNSPPAIYRGIAVFGTPGRTVIAHSFADTDGALRPAPFDRGVISWRYDLDSSVESEPVRIDGAITGLVSTFGDVFFVDVRTGSSVGRTRISGGVETDPVTDGEHMFVASVDQSVYALRPGKRLPVWRYRTAVPLTVQPTYHEGVLYVDVPSEGLIAFDSLTGAKNWVSPEASGEVIAIREGELLCRSREGLTLVDARRGDVLQRVDLPGISVIETEGFVDPVIYAAQPDGTVARFDPR